jgi:hypothetical protein
MGLGGSACLELLDIGITGYSSGILMRLILWSRLGSIRAVSTQPRDVTRRIFVSGALVPS